MRKLGVFAAAAAALAVGAGTVEGGETDRATYDFVLGNKRADRPSSLSLHVQFRHPEDPDAKPPALDSAVLGLPRGMVVDDEAVPQCDATDDDFQLQGRNACPPETEVGQGAVTVMMGLPADPQTLDIVAFNGDGEVIEVVFFPGGVVAGIDRVAIEDGRLVPHPPAPPGGPPDGRTAIRELKLAIPRLIGPTGDPYVTTPPKCRRGTWTSHARFGFADGGETAVASRTPCRPTLRARARSGALAENP
jgi:hypothetical protein